MTNDEEQRAAEEAAGHAKQAAGQAKAAAKEAAAAVSTAAEPVVDRVSDAAQNGASRIEDTAEDALDAARRVNPKIISKITGDTGVGFLALSVCIYSGTVAFYRFRSAFEGRSKVLS